MAQTIVTLCDPCLLHDGKESPGHVWQVSITTPDGKPRAFEIDACDVHSDGFRVLLEFLDRDGRKAGTRPAPTASRSVKPRSDSDAETFACPLCDSVLGSESSRGVHMRTQHGMSVAEAEGRATWPCPETECGRVLGGGQGLSSHLRAAHGWDPEKARDHVRAVNQSRVNETAARARG